MGAAPTSDLIYFSGGLPSTKWGKRRYLVMDTLLNPAKQEAAA
jgi:hypothetical protein